MKRRHHHLTPGKMPYFKRLKTSAGRNFCGNISWFSPCRIGRGNLSNNFKKHDLVCDPAIPLTSVYPKNLKNTNFNIYMYMSIIDKD